MDQECNGLDNIQRQMKNEFKKCEFEIPKELLEDNPGSQSSDDNNMSSTVTN